MTSYCIVQIILFAHPPASDGASVGVVVSVVTFIIFIMVVVMVIAAIIAIKKRYCKPSLSKCHYYNKFFVMFTIADDPGNERGDRFVIITIELVSFANV